ncbi:MAG: putative ABC transporter permease [Oscillospiraceae bacterium]|nr:putative ABC transporter permease [Oscillospiraceae bacterium]
MKHETDTLTVEQKKPPEDGAAKGVRFDARKTFWVFLIGSAIGAAAEILWCFIRTGGFEYRSSLVLSPFLVIYGIGALVLYFVRIKKTVFHMFFFGALAGSAVEFAGSILQELVLGTVSWNYTRLPFNINGRVNPLHTLFWGLLAVLWYTALLPLIEKLIGKIPERVYKPLTTVLAVCFVIDGIVTIAALLRWNMRLEGIPPANHIAAALDAVFHDGYMGQVFADMIRVR